MKVEGSRSTHRRAGPLLRIGDATEAIIEAIEEDNPDRELVVRDHTGFIRVEGADGLILRWDTAERALGRTFRTQEIELLMAGYSGKIEFTDDYVRWYFKHSERVEGMDEDR